MNSSIGILIFGIVLILIGILLYRYYEKNEAKHDSNPGKLFGIFVAIIVLGITILILNFIYGFNY